MHSPPVKEKIIFMRVFEKSSQMISDEKVDHRFSPGVYPSLGQSYSTDRRAVTIFDL